MVACSCSFLRCSSSSRRATCRILAADVDRRRRRRRRPRVSLEQRRAASRPATVAWRTGCTAMRRSTRPGRRRSTRTGGASTVARDSGPPGTAPRAARGAGRRCTSVQQVVRRLALGEAQVAARRAPTRGRSRSRWSRGRSAARRPRADRWCTSATVGGRAGADGGSSRAALCGRCAAPPSGTHAAWRAAAAGWRGRCGAPCRPALKRRWRRVDRFRGAEEQIAARLQREMEHLEHALLRLRGRGRSAGCGSETRSSRENGGSRSTLCSGEDHASRATVLLMR